MTDRETWIKAKNALHHARILAGEVDASDDEFAAALHALGRALQEDAAAGQAAEAAENDRALKEAIIEIGANQAKQAQSQGGRCPHCGRWPDGSL